MQKIVKYMVGCVPNPTPRTNLQGQSPTLNKHQHEVLIFSLNQAESFTLWIGMFYMVLSSHYNAKLNHLVKRT